MRVAILQPNYIPWKGVFDMIHQVDVFIFLDDAQYTDRDWRNRNRIRSLDGATRWLTVPVQGGRDLLICNVPIDHSQNWVRKHLEALRHSYGKAPFFHSYAPRLTEILETRQAMLSDLNIDLTLQICEWLGVRRTFVRSSSLDVRGEKDGRLVELVKRVGGNHYLSGPAAKAYIRPSVFADARIELTWMNYDDYPIYRQISEPFEHGVTVLDLIFATGPEAPDYIWGKHRPGLQESTFAEGAAKRGKTT